MGYYLRWSSGINVGIAIVIMMVSGVGSIAHRLGTEWVQGLTVLVLLEAGERPPKTMIAWMQARRAGRDRPTREDIVRAALWSAGASLVVGAAALLLPRHYYGSDYIAWVIMGFGLAVMMGWMSVQFRALARRADARKAPSE